MTSDIYPLHSAKLRLSLGPVLYYWPRDTVYDYYEQMADLPIDIFYLGETVCSKRREVKWNDWLELAKMLTMRGKQVVMSTLTLLEAESEISTLRRICNNGEFMVEANDMAAVQMLSEMKLRFTTGPFINIYNANSLTKLIDTGLVRWVMPVELSRNTLQRILSEARDRGFADSFETEVFCYGHIPLAFSARCFTARAHDLPKDTCMFVCEDHPSGLMVKSQEQQEVFNLNGIQTQSAAIYDLGSALMDMRNIGVDIVRLSPQLREMSAVIQRFDSLRNGLSVPHAVHAEECNGYWFHCEGMSHRVQRYEKAE